MMTKFRRMMTVLMLAALLLGTLVPAMAADKQPLIGIVQIAVHPALDAAREGFLKALEENGLVDGEQVVIDYRNAQGSQDLLGSIADHFIAQEADMVLAIATPSAQALAGKTKKIPILATAVTDYVEAGLAESKEKPGFNISGTTDMNPIPEQIALIQQMAPDTKSVGLIYSASEANSVLQARWAREVIEAAGMQYVEVTVNSTNDVEQAAQSIMERCDVLYIPTDNTVASSLPIVHKEAVKRKMPIFCSEAGQVLNGGTATLGIDYWKLGYQTGLMALKVLAGEDISAMPIQAQSEFEYTINRTMCEAIGLAIPEELLPFAIDVE